MFEHTIPEDKIHNSGVRARQQKQVAKGLSSSTAGTRQRLHAGNRTWFGNLKFLPSVASFLQQGYTPQTYPLGSEEALDEWSPEWICIIDVGTAIQGPRPQTHGRWQILSACGRGLKLAKPSSSGPSTSVYRWLITWIQKLASNCSSLLLDVYSLRLLAYKNLLPKLANFFFLCCARWRR